MQSIHNAISTLNFLKIHEALQGAYNEENDFILKDVIDHLGLQEHLGFEDAYSAEAEAFSVLSTFFQKASINLRQVFR